MQLACVHICPLDSQRLSTQSSSVSVQSGWEQGISANSGVHLANSPGFYTKLCSPEVVCWFNPLFVPLISYSEKRDKERFY